MMPPCILYPVSFFLQKKHSIIDCVLRIIKYQVRGCDWSRLAYLRSMFSCFSACQCVGINTHVVLV